MQTRQVEFIGNIPLGHIDLFVKFIHNLCLDNMNKLHISSNDMIISLLNEHVDAIANEATTYIELENSVRSMKL